MIKQLRPFYTSEEIAEIYSQAYDHTRWPEHVLRVRMVRYLAESMMNAGIATVADLSCGDGAIALGLGLPRESIVLGDICWAPHLDRVGRIETEIQHIDPVDMFILSETLEHVEHPDDLLRAIRTKTRTLILSTPVGETDDGNWEHYWGWDMAGVESLLREADFNPVMRVIFGPQMPGGYTYQIWGCV